MNCRGCGNKNAFLVRTYVAEGSRQIDECDLCTSLAASTIHDCYVPVGGMHFEALSHPDYPESHGGTYCADKATKAYYLKKYGLKESGDKIGGTNNFDPIAARHARESLRK